MIEVFFDLLSPYKSSPASNKGDGIEQNNQPIGADCRMNGKEKQKAMIHPATPALRTRANPKPKSPSSISIEAIQ